MSKSTTEKTGLILDVKDIESGNWDVLGFLRFADAEMTLELRHQSNRASMSLLEYHHRALTVTFANTLTHEEFRAFVADNQELFNELKSLYSEEFDGHNNCGCFSDTIRAHEIKEYLQEAAQHAAQLECCDYSENDNETIKEICRDYKVDEALLIENDEDRETALENCAKEIEYEALHTSNCVALYVRTMIRAFAEMEVSR